MIYCMRAFLLRLPLAGLLPVHLQRRDRNKARASPTVDYKNVCAASVASLWLLSSQSRSPSRHRTGSAGGTAVAFSIRN